jgi:hypothetical protein
MVSGSQVVASRRQHNADTIMPAQALIRTDAIGLRAQPRYTDAIVLRQRLPS